MPNRHDTVDHQRCRPDASRRFEIIGPDKAQVLDVGVIDLAKLAVACLAIV
jgi:hypothetical protein